VKSKRVASRRCEGRSRQRQRESKDHHVMDGQINRSGPLPRRAHTVAAVVEESRRSLVVNPDVTVGPRTLALHGRRAPGADEAAFGDDRSRNRATLNDYIARLAASDRPTLPDRDREADREALGASQRDETGPALPRPARRVPALRGDPELIESVGDAASRPHSKTRSSGGMSISPPTLARLLCAGSRAGQDR
jgi:hypothetical protein